MGLLSTRNTNIYLWFLVFCGFSVITYISKPDVRKQEALARFEILSLQRWPHNMDRLLASNLIMPQTPFWEWLWKGFGIEMKANRRKFVMFWIFHSSSGHVKRSFGWRGCLNNTETKFPAWIQKESAPAKMVLPWPQYTTHDLQSIVLNAHLCRIIESIA